MAKITIEIDQQDAQAIERILHELAHARTKHPLFPRIPTSQLSILAEEFGEVAKDINDDKDYRTEVAQVAAVCIRMLR
ncbi:MAG: hypothetical protein H7098_07805 [Oligoflexus sp.]|nr:hypothetical protein [Pseudopedobacter sp.]